MRAGRVSVYDIFEMLKMLDWRDHLDELARESELRDKDDGDSR